MSEIGDVAAKAVEAVRQTIKTLRRERDEARAEAERLRDIAQYVALFHPDSLPCDEEMGFDVGAAILPKRELMDQEDALRQDEGEG